MCEDQLDIEDIIASGIVEMNSQSSYMCLVCGLVDQPNIQADNQMEKFFTDK